MHKAVNGAFIGGVVGAGVAAFQAKSGDGLGGPAARASPRARPRAPLAGGFVGIVRAVADQPPGTTMSA